MTVATERQLPDGRVELRDTRTVESSPLYNHDLAPVPIARRNWTTYNYAALWVSMAHCIPTYMLASGLMASGMNWRQALFTILLGNTIVLVPILLNSHPGTKYGIPFPVFARAAYGTLGSNVPALMRALVACGWFGIQAWIGGEALHTFFKTVIPGWPTLLGAGAGGHTTTEWLSFLLFWGLNVFIIYRGMDLVREVENWAAPFVLVMTARLLVWAVRQAHGFGPLIHQPGKLYPPTGSSAQLLLQRLGSDDPTSAVRAHIDLGTDDVEAEAERLVGLGAERLGPGRGWIVLRDPVGMVFCVTGNSPDDP